MTHSRINDASVRKTDASRKEARQAKDARKEAEKAEKQADLQRLKKLKREAILKKLKKVKQAAGQGIDDSIIEAVDLEGDFDDAKHAQEMARMFDENWYAQVCPFSETILG